MKKYILAIDQGTTGSTAVLFDEKAKPCGKGYCEFKQIYPQPGWVEHHPKDILDSVKQAIKSCLKQSKLDPQHIVSIGITNQRETIVSWNKKTGQPDYNAIVWQCRRTSEYTNKLKKDKKLASFVFKKTGLVIDPYFSASKMRWLIKNKKITSESLIGTIDSFLIWNLTAGLSFFTDPSNASRTQLMDLKTLDWDDDLLKLFSVDKKRLPQIIASNSNFGLTKGFGVLPDGIPITGVLGDQQAALFGQGALTKGEAKCTFGTGSFILLNIGDKPRPSTKKLLTTVAWKLKDEKAQYAFEGGAFICGAAVQFLRDQMKFFKTAKDIEALAVKANPESEVICVPAFAGLGAPYWDPDVKAAFLGLTRGDGQEEIAYATLKSMAMQNYMILDAMEKDLGETLKSLKVDGGAVQNKLLMQIQSDVLGKKVLRPSWLEATALGAAYMSGLGFGIWSMNDISKMSSKSTEVFSPLRNKVWREKSLRQWSSAIKAVKAISHKSN